MFHFQAEAPYMGGCGCGYVQAAPYVEYAPPYPVLMGRLEPMYGIAPQSLGIVGSRGQ
jgi:hypothetical protein